MSSVIVSECSECKTARELTSGELLKIHICKVCNLATWQTLKVSDEITKEMFSFQTITEPTIKDCKHEWISTMVHDPDDDAPFYRHCVNCETLEKLYRVL